MGVEGLGKGIEVLDSQVFTCAGCKAGAYKWLKLDMLVAVCLQRKVRTQWSLSVRRKRLL